MLKIDYDAPYSLTVIIASNTSARRRMSGHQQRQKKTERGRYALALLVRISSYFAFGRWLTISSLSMLKVKLFSSCTEEMYIY
ncbi:hypothetical protein PAHAL_1G203700 [Panicum hallii]|uniref:Uncharacterized protein n=1 Tax=Panicum hallii TaxID=206008 RepID=A0A2T8KW02_9POAL|nr:hypothetical protein PAHAL_1G203700 [Panicum hallii]